MKKSRSGVDISQRPQAWIAVSNNRQKLYGEDQDKIYLEDGQEFQIELYNPTSTTYLSKIYINGKLMSSSGLVLKPGQRYFLDRHIDVKKKLVFSTYDVENSEEVKKAIEKNGLVKVEFYAETTPNAIAGITWDTFTTYPTYTSPTYNPPTYNPTITFGGSTINTLFTTTNTSNQIVGNSSYTTNLVNCSAAGSLSTTSILSTTPIETGRVEEGSKSDQNFGKDNGTYSIFKSYESEYQILPRSTKPVEISEIREYCTECGTRIKKKSWKFCPSCGGNLE